MSRLSEANVLMAREIIGRFPRPKSALIPLLHLVQEQDGHVTADGMTHVAELLGITPSEVYGTASFYEMFKFEPVGRYCINVCTNISCQLLGAWELLEHAEERLGVKAGGTTEDGKVTTDDFDQLVDDLRADRLADEIPPHGTLARVRQRVPADRWAGTGTAAQAKVDAR